MITQYEMKQLFHSISSMQGHNINGTSFIPLENVMHILCSYIDPACGFTAKFSIDKNTTSLKWEATNVTKEKSNDEVER